MIEMSIPQLARLFTQEGSVPDGLFCGVEIDSRKDCAGKLFIAIEGENFDGHDFVVTAVDKGAVAVLVNRQVDVPVPQIGVKDTRQALAQLALSWRQQVNPRVIAITGSNGKTTVKEMLARILTHYHATLKTEGNLNNDIGVPLTLLRLNRDERFAVVEMGANHRDEIRRLLAIAEPDIVYVNNARSAHVEGFGSLQGVIQAKGEMYQYCPAHALAVFNDDEEAVDYWRSICATDRRMSFSSRHYTDVSGSSERLEDGLLLRVKYQQQQADCALGVYGEHNAQNALAAISLALACDLSLDQVVQGLQGFSGVKGRQQFISGINNSRLIDDTYNANPDSLAAAVKVLCSLQGRHWLALGDMAELGERARDYHLQAAKDAHHAGVEAFFALGDMSCQAAEVFGEQGHCFSGHDEMAHFIAERIHSDVVLLVKGSRSAGMEKVVEALSQQNHSTTQPGVSHAV